MHSLLERVFSVPTDLISEEDIHMPEKLILILMYSATSASGLFLILNIGGVIGTIGGLLLMSFAGMGLVGMLKFG